MVENTATDGQSDYDASSGAGATTNTYQGNATQTVSVSRFGLGGFDLKKIAIGALLFLLITKVKRRK